MSSLAPSHAETRVAAVDHALDHSGLDAHTGQELLAVVDVLDAQPALRRALTDPGQSREAKQALVQRLFGSQVSQASLTVVGEAVALRWNSGRSLTAALERQGIRAYLHTALASGQLDHVEEELFRFGRLVAAHRDLSTSLGDRGVALARRQKLVSTLLDGKANPLTIALARRAVAARERTFDLTLERYLALAAHLRQRAVAHVRVAHPLASEQADRLRGALSRQVGRPVDIHVTVDPTVIGGVYVRLGDEVIDGSVAGKLDEARRQLGS